MTCCAINVSVSSTSVHWADYGRYVFHSTKVSSFDHVLCFRAIGTDQLLRVASTHVFSYLFNGGSLAVEEEHDRGLARHLLEVSHSILVPVKRIRKSQFYSWLEQLPSSLLTSFQSLRRWISSPPEDGSIFIRRKTRCGPWQATLRRLRWQQPPTGLAGRSSAWLYKNRRILVDTRLEIVMLHLC